MPLLEYVESDLSISDGPSRELENFALSEKTARLGITKKECATIPDFETFFASPTETLEHLFDKIRNLTG